MNLYLAAEFQATGLAFSADQGFAYFHFASCSKILKKREINPVEKLLAGIPNAGMAVKESLRKPLTTDESRISG